LSLLVEVAVAALQTEHQAAAVLAVIVLLLPGKCQVAVQAPRLNY
jgi:hypothetical protein